MINMKKFLCGLLSMAVVFSLAACGSENVSAPSSEPSAESTEAAAESQDLTESAESQGASAESQEPSTEVQEASDTGEMTEEEAGGILVAYFSWSGNTRQMAQMIQEETDGELFEISPAVPYTDDYDTLLDVAQQEQADNARPELAGQVENWDSYDIVFVGYPDWWSDAPMLIYSFLESYDWEGKTLIPFCTSGGSGFGRSLDQIPDSAPGATVLEGLHVSGSSVDSAGEDIAAWIDSLNLA